MSFSSFTYISKPGYKVNEDAAYANESFAWVLDGATGLNKSNITPADSDAQWFTEQWNIYLKENIEKYQVSLKSIITEGIQRISKSFYSFADKDKIEKINLPSASIAVVRINNNKIEYFLLGDCTLLLKDKSGIVSCIKDHRLERLDEEAINRMEALRVSEGLSFQKAREKITPYLIQNRLLKNTPQGYWTLEFETEAVSNSICGEINTELCSSMLLMSDGFSALCDKYNVFSLQELFSEVERSGVDKVYNTLREIEEKDNECLMFPRFKKSDDASAAFIYI